MNSHNIDSPKHSLSKWLVALILLAGVFAFSGPGISPRCGPSPMQSTWIIRGSKPAVNGVPFSTGRAYLSKWHKAGFAGYSLINLSLLHSEKCSLQLKHCQRADLVSCYKMPAGVLRTIPQNGKADPSILV